jgi:hypothetical protein
MSSLRFRVLQVAEPVEYFLPLVRAERRQNVQDFCFAHAQSLRQGTPKDKRSGPLAYPPGLASLAPYTQRTAITLAAQVAFGADMTFS